MANVHYPHLFTPITVRGKRIKNRIASAPHCGPNMFRCGENGYSNFTETAVQYFGALARGGAGIVNTGHLGVDPRYYLGNNAELFNFFSTHSIHEHTLPVMHLMTDMIHSYGALASIELNHGGMFCTPVTPGTPLLWPSEDTVSTPNGPLAVKAMDEQDMHEVAEYFANAARIGRRGGFDVVNVHAGHDWLLGAFLSPLDNRRTDAYGGSVRNRARFLCIVLQHVRQAVGEDMLIEVRLSASELAPGGITLEDTVQTVRLIAPYVDIVQCSAGRIRDGSTSGFTFPLQYMERGCNTYLARRVRAETGVLVETVGGIGTPEMAEGLIKDGTADFVGMARAWIADPDWARKAQAGRAKEIRPCIRCLRCMHFSDPPQSGLSVCTVNPRRRFPHPLAQGALSFQPKRVAVVGGGPAGMQAACELAQKGHSVTLFERSPKLGGLLEYADHIPFKHDIACYRQHLEYMLRSQANVEVCLNTEATPALLQRAGRFDAVVLALGAKPFVPSIPIEAGANAFHAAEAFNGHTFGDVVAVIGGGAVGCEFAVYLQSLGKHVQLAEVRGKLLADMEDMPDEAYYTEFFLTHELSLKYKHLYACPETDRVRIHTNAACVRVTREGAVVRKASGQEVLLAADTVLFATGFQGQPEAAEAYEALGIEVVPIGDCLKAGTLLDTALTGYFAAQQL